MIEPADREQIEIDLLLEAVFRCYGYDFRHYSRASLQRRIQQAMTRLHCKTISELTARLIHDPQFFQSMVAEFSITVTEMFRDPAVYQTIREKVVPCLATYPFIKIWHAGCATGEEAYSLAILLTEEGLYDRTTIYATDFNEQALSICKEGIYPLGKLQEYSRNYLKGGGAASFSDYYHAQYNSAIMASSLKRNITFARHNLVTDQVFGEMHLILCRNVLIYFDHVLQDRALQLFDESLVHNGFLCLGSHESLQFSSSSESFSVFDRAQRIYRKRGAL